MAGIVLFSIGWLICLKNNSKNMTQQQLPQKWHLNGLSKNGLSNDTQTILKNGQKYELFYLVDTGKGLEANQQRTRWARSVSSDLTTFKVADNTDIKPVSQQESVATGSIVKDTDNLSGHGKNSLLAYATKYINGNQWTYMWYSTNQGENWHVAHNGKPVAKPYKEGKDFRDPHVIYDSDAKQFVMTVAEADDNNHMKIGFYISKNGTTWQYTDSFYSPRDLGTLEVPEIHQIYQKNNNQKQWILFFGANGFADDFQKSTGSYYVVGQLKNGQFEAETDPERVDFGTDYYAAHNYQENNEQLLGFGWMGNWDYINRVTSKIITNGLFDTKKKTALRAGNGDSNVSFHFNNFDKKMTVHRQSNYVTNDAYNKDYNINLWGDWSEKVDFYVDQYSIEVFWPKTGQVATFAKYSNDSGDNIVFDNLDNKSSSLVVQEMK
jgi:levanbiose-producing levanase